MLTDTEARRIAADFHGPDAPALTALSTSGAIMEPILNELERHTMLYGADPVCRKELTALAVYCFTKGKRGPVDGWSKLSY